VGIVQRQSVKNSIVNYFGVIVGGLSTLFIYPLNWDLYGNIQFSLTTAVLISTLFSLGSQSLVNKYFPYFKNNDLKGLLSVIFLYTFINLILVTILLFLFKEPIFKLLELTDFNVKRVQENAFIIFPIAILLIIISIFKLQSYNIQRIVFPDILSGLSVKFITPIIILLYYYSAINYQGAGWILVLFHALIAIGLMIYLHVLGALDFSRKSSSSVSKSKHWEMIQYMMFSALNLIGNTLAYKVDIIMIGLLLSATKVGYYSIFLFMTVAIEIPMKAIQRITNPIIAESLENNDLKKINSLYQATSTNLFIVGIILFSLIWMNMDVVFQIMTNGDDLVIYKTVFLFLALTQIFEMITSINIYIISYSKYYRMNTLFLIFLAVINITLNYILIGKLDIFGAALSTAISLLLFNFLKTIFIYHKYKMQPLQWNYILLLIFLLIAIWLPIQFPEIFADFKSSIPISIIFTVILIFTIYKMNYSKEINEILEKYISILRR